MGIWFSVSSCPEFLKVFIFFFFLFFGGKGVCSNISIKILIWATLIPKRKQSMWIKIEVFTSVWDQTAWIFVQSVLYVKEEFKAFLTTPRSPFHTAMYHMELLPASRAPCSPLISPGLGFPFSPAAPASRTLWSCWSSAKGVETGGQFLDGVF